MSVLTCPLYLSIVSEAPQCVLKPMPNAEKAYVWFVQDFAEGEAQVEKFAIRPVSYTHLTLPTICSV